SATVPLGADWAVTARAGTRYSGDMRIPQRANLGSRLSNTKLRNRSASAGAGYIGQRIAGGMSAQLYDFSYGLPVPPGAPEVSLDGRRYELRGNTELETGSSLFPSLRVNGSVQDYRHDELDDSSSEVLQQFDLDTRSANAMLRQGSIGSIAEGSWGVSALFKDYSASGPAALTPPAASRGLGA